MLGCAKSSGRRANRTGARNTHHAATNQLESEVTMTLTVVFPPETQLLSQHQRNSIISTHPAPFLQHTLHLAAILVLIPVRHSRLLTPQLPIEVFIPHASSIDVAESFI
uniref:Uncharacterized protein n=1 Tax=Zooxanthella nutricula TaxID=1333877 RepID=A0A6U6N733_9DINO